jgi:hypothetical protein
MLIVHSLKKSFNLKSYNYLFEMNENWAHNIALQLVPK